MKTEYTKFYAITYYGDRWGNAEWVWSRKNKWIAPWACFPKPLTYEGAVRKCKEAAKKDHLVVSWKALPTYEWHW